MPDDLLERLRDFRQHAFPDYAEAFQRLVADGQHPSTLFIGCSDSRVVPHLLIGSAPGELFLVRNVGAFVPPFRSDHGHHGTSAAIEFAVLNLRVRNIVVCGHSHCGAIRALYDDCAEEAVNLNAWLGLGRDARLPMHEVDAGVLRRTEQRSVVLQLERLLDYPMVRRRVDAGTLTLHGWHYIIEDGEVHTFDIRDGRFIPATLAEHSGIGLAPVRGAPPICGCRTDLPRGNATATSMR
jgi:carbonic anhydrase